MRSGALATEELPEAVVAGLLDAYGIKPLRLAPLPGGMENTHVRAWTSTGAVVLTVLRKKTAMEAEQYARFLLHLARTGAPVPRLRPLRDGGWVTDHSGRPVIVCDFVEGRSPQRLPPRLVHEAGVVLGRVHRTAVGLDSPLLPYLRLGDTEASLLASLPDGPFARWARATYHAVGYVPEQSAPLVPVHADLFPDNIVVQGRDRLVFLDWEDGSLDLPVMDVGMAVLGLCCHRTFSLRRARSLLRGYREGSGADLDTGLVRDAALYAAVVTALRRYRWQHDGHLPATPLRSAIAMHQLALSLTERWPRLRL